MQYSDYTGQCFSILLDVCHHSSAVAVTRCIESTVFLMSYSVPSGFRGDVLVLALTRFKSHDIEKEYSACVWLFPIPVKVLCNEIALGRFVRTWSQFKLDNGVNKINGPFFLYCGHVCCWLHSKTPTKQMHYFRTLLVGWHSDSHGLFRIHLFHLWLCSWHEGPPAFFNKLIHMSTKFSFSAL